MRLLAIIPARGGSKGIPRKNIRLLCGRPLIAYSIDAAQEARSVDRMIGLDRRRGDSRDQPRALAPRCASAPRSLRRTIHRRAPVLAHVVAELGQAILYTRRRVDAAADLAAAHRAHIDEAADSFGADPRADSLVSCVEVPHIFHPLSVMRRNAEGYLEPFFAAASAAPPSGQAAESSRAMAPQSTSPAPRGYRRICFRRAAHPISDGSRKLGGHRHARRPRRCRAAVQKRQ